MNKALRTIRTRQGMTLEDLASRAKCSGDYIRKLEAGYHSPTLGLARRLAVELGVTLDELFPPKRSA